MEFHLAKLFNLQRTGSIALHYFFECFGLTFLVAILSDVQLAVVYNTNYSKT